MRAWMEVFSSAEITNSSGRCAVSVEAGGRRGRAHGPPWVPKSGVAGGRSRSGAARVSIASELSQRPRRGAEIEAAMPCSMAVRGQIWALPASQRLGLVGLRRALAGHRLDGYDDVRGETPGPCLPRVYSVSPAETLVEEAFAPFGDDLPRRV